MLLYHETITFLYELTWATERIKTAKNETEFLGEFAKYRSSLTNDKGLSVMAKINIHTQPSILKLYNDAMKEFMKPIGEIE